MRERSQGMEDMEGLEGMFGRYQCLRRSLPIASHSRLESEYTLDSYGSYSGYSYMQIMKGLSLKAMLLCSNS